MTPSPPSRPPVVVATEWTGDLVFAVRAGDHVITTDGDGRRGLSPVQLLAAGLAGCMATDVALILTRGREPLEALTVTVTATRADSDPRRLVGVTIRFEVGGAVSQDKLDRAIALSRDTYCSVWHSLREDVTLATETSITPAC